MTATIIPPDTIRTAPARVVDRPVPTTRLVTVELRKMFTTRSGFWMLVSIGVLTPISAGSVIIFAPDSDVTYESFTRASGFPMSLILPMMPSFGLPMNVVRKGPVRWLRAGPWSAWCRGVRCGGGAGQSAPVSEMAIRAAFSSTVGLFRANAEVSALTARLLIARG